MFAQELRARLPQRLGADQVLIPISMSGKRVFRYLEGDVAWRAARRGQKVHVCFLRSAVAFLDIALEASRHDVLPRVYAALGARLYVVDSKVVPALAAVLARVIVPVQDIAAGQAYLFIGDLDVIAEPNNSGEAKCVGKHLAVVFDAFCLAFKDENDGAAPAAYVQGFV
jgi:hypothetical protein